MYLYDKYSMDTEFNPLKEIEETNCGDMFYDVAWLIEHCSKMQTQEMFEYYLGLNPISCDVLGVICSCKVLQTPENFDRYLLFAKSHYEDVSWLIFNCKVYQTKEYFAIYMGLDPSGRDIKWFVSNCQPFREWYFAK
jgi:hypothetical protein